MHRVYADFAYQPADDIVRPGRRLLVEADGRLPGLLPLHGRRAALLGLAGRYVSGYLATRPPPGRPRLVGADASHAWVGVWVPGVGWIHLDPTNDRLIDASHATVAWGRDYGDVTPVKGVIFTEAKNSTR